MKSYDANLECCPFCGSKSVQKALLPGFSWVIGCNDCGCRTKEYISSLDAAAAWNRRVVDPDDDPRSVREVMGEMNMPILLDHPESAGF